MQVSTNLVLDLQRPNINAIVHAKQNDKASRSIVAKLMSGESAFMPPNGANYMIRYGKSDGTGGMYDKIEDGETAAVTINQNTATIRLVEQALTAPGPVVMELNIYDSTGAKLTTFSWIVFVEESAFSDEEIVSTNYFNILTEEIALAVQAGNVAQQALDTVPEAAQTATQALADIQALAATIVGSVGIDDAATRTTTTWSSQKIAEQLEGKTEKVRIDFDGTTFRLDGTAINYKQLYDIHLQKPDFAFVVYGDRAYLLSYVQDGAGMKEMRFQSVLAVTDASGLSYVKTSGIYVLSNDGINIASVRVTDINSENKAYKVDEITDANKNSTVMYPSVKAVNEQVSELKNDLTELEDLMLPTLVGHGAFEIPYKTDTYTEINLKSGKTYIIGYHVETANSVNAFAKGDKSTAVTLLKGEGTAEFTPAVDGVLTFYTSSAAAAEGCSVEVTVNEKRISISDLVEQHDKEIKDIKEKFGGDELVGSGTYSVTKGVNLTTDIPLVSGKKYIILYYLHGATYVNLMGATGSDKVAMPYSDIYAEFTPTTTSNARLYTSNNNCVVEIYVFTKRNVETDTLGAVEKPRTDGVPHYEPKADGNIPSFGWNILDLYKYPPIPTWGMEYLAAWYSKIYAGENVKIDFEGDSITWYGYRIDCVEKIMDIGGYAGNVEYNNNGYGNRSTNEWAGTGWGYTNPQDEEDFPNGIIHQGIASNSDLMICGYGINDAVIGADSNTTTIEERVRRFEENYREVLMRIRGNVSVNGRPAYNKSAEVLPIILCMPTYSNRDNRHYEQWHMYIRSALQKLCREFKCAFCDFSMITYDEYWSPNNIWSRMYDDGSKRDGLHPNKDFTMAYASILQTLIYPVGLWSK